MIWHPKPLSKGLRPATAFWLRVLDIHHPPKAYFWYHTATNTWCWIIKVFWMSSPCLFVQQSHNSLSSPSQGLCHLLLFLQALCIWMVHNQTQEKICPCIILIIILQFMTNQRFKKVDSIEAPVVAANYKNMICFINSTKSKHPINNNLRASNTHDTQMDRLEW